MLCKKPCKLPFDLDPRRVLLIFAASNFLFMGFDVALAHSYNRFADPREWYPIAYSAMGGLTVLLYGVLREPGKLARSAFWIMAWIGFSMGVAGLYLHLAHAAWHEVSLRSLVYAAPIAAPLSYSGVALIALTADGFFDCLKSVSRRQCLLLLVGAGFSGNLALTTLDHARNGFFRPEEWFSVAAAAFGAVVLLWAGASDKPSTREEYFTILAALVLQIFTGLIGFVFHLYADWHNIMATVPDKIIFGAPIFAPLLFCDIAVLGIIAVFIDSAGMRWVLPGSSPAK